MTTARKPWVRVVTAVAAAAVCGATVVGAATAAGAAPADSPGQIIAQEKLAPLKEFRTPGDAGWFYTLSDGEAAAATSRYGFRQLESIGWLHTEQTPGSVGVHRLRAKSGGPSYMLSVSPAEFADGRFVDEGVVGYIDAERHEGETRLLRFSNHGQWRVLSDNPANIAGMKKAGYTVDGPMGWYRS